MLIALLAGSHVLPAQQPAGLLAGVVRDGHGQPVGGVLVAFDTITTSQRLTRSDSAGHFRFERVARGPHELAVAAAGDRTAERTSRTPSRPVTRPPESAADRVVLRHVGASRRCPAGQATR